MSTIAETIARLSKLPGPAAHAGDGRLTALDGFGSNPGALRGLCYVPAQVGGARALVVVLHGCTQTAAGYDAGSGWSQLADRYGFALLFPEQQRQNNPNGCFNWFLPGDQRRGEGEALSIRQMVAAMIAGHGLDPARVYVTGLSAGGAMASVMLATYPDVFAGGAIIAGLPYGCAGNVPQALERMRGQRMPSGEQLAALVRDASPHAGPWPTLSIWHGTGDATVNPSNAEAIIAQWRGLHGVAARPDRVETVDGYPRRVWTERAGREVIEEFSITGMAHGTPLSTGGERGCGAAGPFMLEASISSTFHICRFWGLVTEEWQSEDAAGVSAAGDALVPAAVADKGDVGRPTINPSLRRVSPPETGASGGIAKTIEDALRSAGLMR